MSKKISKLEGRVETMVREVRLMINEASQKLEEYRMDKDSLVYIKAYREKEKLEKVILALEGVLIAYEEAREG